MPDKDTDFLNRYTTLPILLDILSKKRITLLNPNLWEDRNDSFCIEQYKKKKKIETALALCFSGVRETFHHWKVFSSGSAGVCIEFDKHKLIEGLAADKGFIHRKVVYRTITTIENKKPALDDIPFIKRHPYRDECEYRILYTNKTEKLESKEISIKADSISKVTLSPWLHESLADAAKIIIRGIDGFSTLSVKPSSLLENERWKNAIEASK